MNIAILSSSPLLAEGLAIRFRQSIPDGMVKVVSSKQLNYVDELTTLEPDFVLLDVSEIKSFECYIIYVLITKMPTLKIALVDVNNSDFLIIEGQKYGHGDVNSMVKLFTDVMPDNNKDIVN